MALRSRHLHLFNCLSCVYF